MGGAREVIRRARESFARGDYRWVAEVMNHVVFAEPNNQEAKELEAAAFEQLGYQAESGPWRNFYLTGASELRSGVRRLPAPSPVTEGALHGMTSSMIFDYLAVKLDGTRAADKAIRLNLRFTDTHEDSVLALGHGVLNAHRGRQDARAEATLSCTRPTFDRLVAGTATLDELVRGGDLRIEGRAEAVTELMGLFDQFDFWFPIVTP